MTPPHEKADKGETEAAVTYSNRKKTAWLIVNFLLLVFEIYLGYAGAIRSGTGFQLSHLQRYSHYANSCLFITTLFLFINCIYDLIRHKERSKYPIRLFRYMAVSASMVEFMVVVFLLFPMGEFKTDIFFSENNFLEYIVCPLLAYISFAYLGEYTTFGRKEAVIATIPAFIYHTVILILNLRGIITGPYAFQRAREQGQLEIIFWYIVIVGGSYAVSCSLLILSKMHSDRSRISNRAPLPEKTA